MKLQLIILAVLALGTIARAQISASRQAYEHLLFRYNNDTNFSEILAEHMRKFGANARVEPVPLFSCKGSKSNEIPKSVNALLPGDIKVVGALGDSITAGNGILAETLVDVILNERGHVFSAGGYSSFDGGVITVPNILKNYNSRLYGYALGEAAADDPEAMFNVAIGGSTAEGLPDQATDIISRMTNDNNVDMVNDWKMITLFIGGNDLCRVCNDEARYGPSEYIRHIENTLNILSSKLSRAIVNVMPIMDVTPLPELSEDIICDGIQAIACSCGVDPTTKDQVKRIQAEYASLLESLSTSERFDREDFTVVYHPFLRDTVLPRDIDGNADSSYFSPDCFHFSEKGHKGLAINLWNSLFQPVGQKATSATFKEAVVCPTEGQFIATNKNSKSQQAQWQGLDGEVVGYKAAAGPEQSPAVSAPVTAIAAVGLLCGLLALAGVGVLFFRNRKNNLQNDV